MVVDSSKFTKGKGPHGGANAAHHPRPKNRAGHLNNASKGYLPLKGVLCFEYHIF